MGVANGPQPDEKMTAMDLMKKAVELDVSLVQIADNCPLEKLSGEELDALASYAVAHGLNLEVGTKGIEEQHLLHLLEIALKLGSPILRVLPAFFGSTAVMALVEENIRKVIRRFENAGVTMVLENTEAFRAAEYAALMERIGHPRFKMCLDLANALGIMEGPEFVLDKLMPHVGNFHFKDVRVKRSESVIGFNVYGTPAGEGDLSLPWILEQFRTHGVETTVILELWPPFVESIEKTMLLEEEWTLGSVDYARSVLS
jgi:sugar phosphate isomerase/epimerase